MSFLGLHFVVEMCMSGRIVGGGINLVSRDCGIVKFVYSICW